MRGFAFLALALAGLVACGVMPLAAAASPRRALTASNYVNSCYEKSHGGIARWAIDYMCADVSKGATETWMMELATAEPTCTKRSVTVTIGANGEPIATTSKGLVCKTVNRRVAVDEHMCATYAEARNTVCRGYIDDRVKSAKSHNMLTVHEVPEPKFAATARFQIRLKANCRSIANPKYVGWFATGQVLEGRSCAGAQYWGDFTWGEVPKEPWAPVPGPAGPGRGPGPNGNPSPTPSPTPGASPPDDGHEDVDDDKKDRKSGRK